MSRILKLLKHGASFTAGFITGATYTVRAKNPSSMDQYSINPEEHDVFRGRTCTMRLDHKRAQEYKQWAHNIIEEGDNLNHSPNETKTLGVINCEGKSFMVEDMKDIRRKLSHGIADTPEDELIEIEITDRQRLHLYDCVLGYPHTTLAE